MRVWVDALSGVCVSTNVHSLGLCVVAIGMFVQRMVLDHGRVQAVVMRCRQQLVLKCGQLLQIANAAETKRESYSSKT